MGDPPGWRGPPSRLPPECPETARTGGDPAADEHRGQAHPDPPDRVEKGNRVPPAVSERQGVEPEGRERRETTQHVHEEEGPRLGRPGGFDSVAVPVRGAHGLVRHPLYASFITLGAPAVAVFLDHWVFLLRVGVVHLAWRLVIPFGKRLVVARFGDEYRDYASRTGRFVPRLRARRAK